MRTRAYKEDVATQPRSVREFAMQTLCSDFFLKRISFVQKYQKMREF